MKFFKQLGVLLHRFWNQLTTQGIVMTAWAGTDTILRSVTGKPVRRLSEITPQIFVGGQPAMSFWKTLHEWDVGGVVNMRGEYDYTVKADALNLSLSFLHLPTVDTEAPTLEHLHEGVDFIQKQVATGCGVYIHCWEGLGRGPTMAAAYLVSTGMSPQEAWDKIREVRPFIRPTDVQIERLETFTQLLYQSQ
ncbi:MAG: dual specificity protein phosphatase family protein [Anaerolineae bacterium]